LARALLAVHRTHGGLKTSALLDRIAAARSNDDDIKVVWAGWTPKPSKRTLADQLWPALKKNIDDARFSESIPMPAVADVVYDAYLLAQESNMGNFVFPAVQGSSTTDTSAPAGH
jgi:hypothetical protein